MADPQKQSRRSQMSGRYPTVQGIGNDADFGTFTPPSPNNVGYAQFDTWTQFSGIPSQSGGTEQSYDWNTFVTPPSTPNLGATYGLAGTPDVFSAYTNPLNNVGIGRVSPLDFDADPRVADSSIASSPLAKSLLEAQMNAQTPTMPPLDARTVPGMPPGPVAFPDHCQEGQDLYGEALKKWYNPFGTADVFQGPNDSPSPVVEAETQVYNPSNSNSSSKPTYSDVAKSKKSRTLSGSSREKGEEFDISKKRSDSSGRCSFKSGGKKFISRQGGVKDHVGKVDDLVSTVSPDSKYGLDQFEDVHDVNNAMEEKDEKLESIENLSGLHRRNSTSSVSSGTSGIEEIHLTKSLNNYPSTGNADAHSSGKKDNTETKCGKDKTNMHTENNIHVKPFFDARRIFGHPKETNKRSASSIKHASGGAGDSSSTVLNNGKPACASWCSTSAHRKTTDYINNDLRDSKKKTNQNFSERENIPPRNVRDSGHSNVARLEKQRSRNCSTSQPSNHNSAKPAMPLQTTFDQELIDEWLNYLFERGKALLHNVWAVLLMGVLLIFSIIVYLVSGCVHIVAWIWSKLWYLIQTRILKRKYFAGGPRWGRSPGDIQKKIGLDENIALPSTGDEAMQRLLSCKGKDPYSILGLKSTATDEDIKKYYRRQAVLVHPDKNQQLGAEEAFKILGHAFDLIGDATKRSQYDRQLQEAHEAEAAMRQFNDLLTKLQEKLQEASNMMRCDNCGGKHRRIPVDRPWYSARSCDRCNIKHSAKEGDVWAETSMLGFLWHYYALMEGKVYDITEWVACKKDFFKHMQANAHHVFYRIATEGSRGQHHGRGGEHDLDDFINHLFHQAMKTDGQTQWQQPQQASTGQNWNNASATTSTGTGKRNRRKKKKH